MVEFRFTLTHDEYYQFNYYTAWAAPIKRRFRAWYFLRVILIYAAIAFVYIYFTRSHILWVDVSVFMITGLVYLLLIPYFIRRSVRRRVRNILSRKENQHVLEPAVIILSESGIIDRDTASESRYEWDAIVHFADTPQAYYLYTNSHHAIVIPKRVITSRHDLEETERLMNMHLPLQA